MATDAEANISERLRQEQYDASWSEPVKMPRRFKQSNKFSKARPIPRRFR